jgi:hypothetical protein
MSCWPHGRLVGTARALWAGSAGIASTEGQGTGGASERHHPGGGFARVPLVPGIRVWTAHEDELVRTLPIAETTRQTGWTEVAVISRRYRLRKTSRDL